VDYRRHERSPTFPGGDRQSGRFSGGCAFQPSTADGLGVMWSICGDGSATCTSADFRDITSGSAEKYKAAVSWDFATGLGSVQGLAGK
jgi:hypothetical protein